MRIYETCAEMHSDVKRDLHEMGTRVHPQTMQDQNVSNDPGFETLELSPCSFMILKGGDRDDWVQSLGGNLDWCRADFNERIFNPYYYGAEGPNPGDAWKLRADVWEQFIHNGRFAYTYGERFGAQSDVSHSTKSAIQRVIEQLRVHPDTRQAILPVFDGFRDLPHLGGKQRVPCSLHYQFMRRRGELDMVYVMRSSDFHTHFMYDIWMALSLQDFVSGILQIEPGRFTFFTGSLHIYAKDADPGVF